jgi:tRNA A-37 threonylcarbamoyl transferase component Bud32
LFELPSHLRRISSGAFRDIDLSVIALPSSICYIPSDVFPDDCQISFIADDVSYDFWRCSKIFINREAILRVLARYDLDLFAFEREKNPDTCTRFGTSVSLYRSKTGGVEIAAKEIRHFDSIEDSRLLEFLEMLTHLTHPSIVPLFGFVFPTNSTHLTIATLYYRNGSLKEVLANPPSWWTPTAKSKAIAGIVVGMRFAHSLGFAHGSLKPSNILFDENHNVQIVDFCSNGLRGCLSNDVDVSGKCDSENEEEALVMDVDTFLR